MTTQNTQPRWVPSLTYIEYFILLRILHQGLAGIEIFEALARETNGQLVLSPGTLYAALKRMLAQELIEMVDADHRETQGGDPRRKAYRATTLGRKRIAEMRSWLQRELAAINEALEQPLDPPHAPRTISRAPSVAARRRGRRFAHAKTHESTELALA